MKVVIAERTAKLRPADFVAGDASGKMLPYETYAINLKRLCARAGLREVSPHELRHSCSEFYVERGGATAEDIRRLLNHKSLTSTSAYIHRTPERLNGIVNRAEFKILDRPSDRDGDNTERETQSIEPLKIVK